MTNSDPRLLIFRWSAIGDCVNCLPLLRALREGMPRAHIGWVTEEQCAGVLEGHPYLDQVFRIPKRDILAALRSGKVWQAWRLMRSVAEEIREAQFDIALDLHGVLKIFALLPFCGIPRRVGFTTERPGPNRWVKTDLVEPRRGHAVPFFTSMARYFDLEPDRYEYCFYLSDDDRAAADDLLAPVAAEGPLIALKPGASQPHKAWFMERYGELARRLRRGLNAGVVIIGGSDDTPRAREIVEHAGMELLDLTGKTSLRQVGAVLERCDILVTPDTGPMHISSAVGTPTVALLGPTVREATAPFGDFHEVVEHQADFECAPCRKRPTCEDRACMAAITVGEVWAAILRRLEAGKPSPPPPLRDTRVRSAG